MRVCLPLVPRWVRFGAVVAVGAVILYYSVVPAPGSGSFRTGPLGLFPFSDWLHLLAYGGFAVTLAYAFQHSTLPEWQVLLAVFLVTVGYGASIELLQAGLPNRTFAVADMVVNALGAALAVAMWRGLTRYVRFYQTRRVTDLELPIQ